jgi:hypothetical protein
MWTARSFAESMALCANATVADSASEKANSVSVRFIVFFPSKKISLNDFRDEAALLVKTRTSRKRHECAGLPGLLNSKEVNKCGLHLQSWISRVEAAFGTASNQLAALVPRTEAR